MALFYRKPTDFRSKEARAVQIQEGSILLLKLYDVADEINLEAIPPDIFAGKLPVKQRLVRVDANSIELVRPPVAVDLGPRAWETASGRLVLDIAAHFFDIGVMGVAARIPVRDVTLEEFSRLALALQQDPEVDRQLAWEVHHILEGVAPALEGPHSTLEFDEEFAFYIIQRADAPLSMKHLESHPLLVSMLQGASRPVSPQQMELALKNSFSFHEDEDLVVLNYNNALVVDREDCGDVLLLVEYAVVQVLEMRYYNDLLTKRLQELHDDADRKLSLMEALFSRRWSALSRRGMKLLLETRLMTDHLTSAVQVTEDVYYAQIYSRALRIFDTQQWLAKVDEKLRSMKEACDLMEHEIEFRRATILEWIVIALIAFEGIPIIRELARWLLR